VAQSANVPVTFSSAKEAPNFLGSPFAILPASQFQLGETLPNGSDKNFAKA